MVAMIAVTGTHSTGKTTFLKEVEGTLQSKGFRVARVADMASRCQDVGFPILRDHTFESTLWIMTSVIRGELEAGLSNDVVLVDRPVSDALGYLEAALAVQDRQLHLRERTYLYELARHHSRRYTKIFQTRLDPTIVLGAGRDEDSKFRSSVDSAMHQVLAEVGIKAEILDLNNRARALASAVEELSLSR